MPTEWWKHGFDSALQRMFGLTIDSAGLDEPDLQRWRENYENDPEAAAIAFGEKYDLTRIDRMWG